MWALQPHCGWMRPWLGCLWKGCAARNTGIWNRICSAVMPNICTGSRSMSITFTGADCMMERWKTMWSLLMVGALVWTVLWDQTFTKAAAASRNSPLRDLGDFRLTLERPAVWTGDVKSDVPTEDISRQTSVGVLGRAILLPGPSSCPTGAHLFTLAAGRMASEKVLKQNHNGQFKPPPKSPFFPLFFLG